MKPIKQKIIDSKLKPLMPSLRQKKRFIRVQIEALQTCKVSKGLGIVSEKNSLTEKKFDFKFISDNLTQKIIYFLGAIDYSNEGVWFLKDKFDFEKQELIIKVSTKLKDKLVGALSLIDKLDKENVNIKIIRVSGTLKGVYKK